MDKQIANINIQYQWLEGQDLSILEPIFREFGWSPLNYLTSRALCAFDTSKPGRLADQLVGFNILQLYPHCEPLWLSPGYRGQGIADELADQMLAFMTEVRARGFMVIADSPHAAALCKSHGMVKLTSPVYVMPDLGGSIQ